MLVDGEPAAAAPAHPVPWWSFTKTVLAAAALRLVATGKLTLDEQLPAQSYSMRQLLRHTSGVRNYSQLDSYQNAVRTGRSPWAPEEMLQRVANGLPAFPPGTLWAYSNTGYAIVRSVIEDITGSPIQAALESLVFAPLGIAGVVVGTTAADLAATAWGNARGYDPRWVFHGLLIGTPIAAARTLHGVLEGGLLPDALVAEMRRPAPSGTEIAGRPWRNFGYGTGLMIALDGPAGPAYGHTGHDWTSVAAVYHFPGTRSPRTVAAFMAGDHEAEIEWAAVNAALAPAP
jgi:CubicO group peptidase (beta-lactamase class C family)